MTGCILVRSAAAQDATEPIGIDYQAPAGCPDSDAFFREITGRTTRVRPARHAEAARKLHVVVVRRGGVFVGRLSIEEITTWSSAREVTDTTCGDVVGALGLVAALAIDPTASLTPLPHSEEKALSAGKATTPSTSRQEGSSPQTPMDRIPATPPTSIEARPGARGAFVRYSAGAQIELAAIADAVLSARIFGDIEGGYSQGAWTPSFRLALGRSVDIERQATSGRATLHVTQASLEFCPLRAGITSSFGIRPCVGMSGGVLDAQGEGETVTNAHARSRPWVTASSHARLDWEPIAALAFEVDAGAVAPLYRDLFYFNSNPTVPIYRAPPVAFVARLGLRVHFP